MGRTSVERPRTTWCRMAGKKRNEMGWKSWEEACKVAVRHSKWQRITETLRLSHWDTIYDKFTAFHVLCYHALTRF